MPVLNLGGEEGGVSTGKGSTLQKYKENGNDYRPRSAYHNIEEKRVENTGASNGFNDQEILAISEEASSPVRHSYAKKKDEPERLFDPKPPDVIPALNKYH